MKNVGNTIKTTQQLIVHLFKGKNSFQFTKNSNLNNIKPNKNILVNFKQSLISKNLKSNIKGNKIGINPTNNINNKEKYKTTKNSPEHLLFQKHYSRQKNFIASNSKKINKMPIMNSISKTIIKSQKNSSTKNKDIIKKKILKINQKKNITSINSNNNSLSLSNSISHNYKHNNSNINLGYFRNNELTINKIKPNKNENQSSFIHYPYSYREIKQKSNSNYDIENNNINNGQIINYTKKGKYYNLINKYISSVSSASKQPMRQHHQKSLKIKFNTIAAKKSVDINKPNSNNNNNYASSFRGVGNSIIEKNIGNFGKIGTIKNINKIKNLSSQNESQNLKNNFIFEASKIYKKNQKIQTNQQIPSLHFDTKPIDKTTYQINRKSSSENSAQNSINHSSLNQMINLRNYNNFIKNYNSPVITVNNHRKSEIINKKVNYLNKGNNNIIYNYSNNKKNITNEIYNNKYRINEVYSSSNSKDHSKDNNNTNKKHSLKNIVDLKRYNVEKIINQLYKNNNNFNNKSNILINNNFANYKEEKSKKNNFSLNYNNINFQDKNINLSSIKKSKEKKDIIKSLENKANHPKNKSQNLNTNIIKKIKLNDGNYSLLYKNKEISPIDIKNNINLTNKIIINSLSCENSINDSKQIKNQEKKCLYISQYKKLHESTKSQENKNENNHNSILENDRIISKIETKEKIDKQYRDKDLSNSENDNDSLLEYINNNIDYNYNNTNNSKYTELSESNDSIMSTLKENGKFTCYNRDMEIISYYIKNYYIKNKKYPSTKMKFYKYGRLLGKGAFGKVNLSLHILTGRLVAIKSINKEKITTERQKQKIKFETKIMKRLSKSNNIVKFFETYETKKHICIVMEYICAGDLLSYIKKRGKLQEPVAKFIFKQIILALKFIHENNIVHRDIKLDNILIDLDNNIKICDFGVSRIINKGDIMLEQCGTPAYIAPEILLNKGYEGFKVDVWSAGVVLYAMLSGTVPFKGANIKELHKLIISGNYQQLKDISKEASHLLKNILEIDPDKRITTENILNHPWIVDVNLNFWKNQNLFTNAEYILLAKSNVDYRNISNKEDMIENFDLRNLDTIEENMNKNIKTKSFILAPFNTSISEEENIKSQNNDIIFSNFYDININNKFKEITDFNNPDLKILNGAIKYVAKVKELNRNYELNNNQDIDNGIVIQNDSDDKIKKDNNISSNNESFNSKVFSKLISPPNEIEEINNSKNKDEINEKALEILQNLGYEKSYIRESIIKNNFNYATTSYKLIVKYCFS